MAYNLQETLSNKATDSVIRYLGVFLLFIITNAAILSAAVYLRDPTLLRLTPGYANHPTRIVSSNPSATNVQAGGYYSKVFSCVVKPVIVDVIDMFFGIKLSSNHSFQNYSVKNSSSFSLAYSKHPSRIHKFINIGLGSAVSGPNKLIQKISVFIGDLNQMINSLSPSHLTPPYKIGGVQ